MYTIYDCCVFIATVVAFSFVNGLTTIDIFKLIAIVILSILVQPLFCKSCLTSHSLAAYLATIPLLISLFFDCYQIYILIFAFSIACAIGRIGCFFSGCCTGKLSSHFSHFSILYPRGTIIADHLLRPVRVVPTILIEIFFAFFISFIILFSKYGLLLYGPINLLLIFFSYFWRFTPRADFHFLPIISLALFSIIIHFKQCYRTYHLPFVFKPFSLIFALIFSLFFYYDIHISSFYKMLNI